MGFDHNGSTWIGPNSTNDTGRIQKGFPSISLVPNGSQWQYNMGHRTVVDFDLNTTVTGNNTTVSLFLDVLFSSAGPDGNPPLPDRYPLGSDC